MNAKDTNHLVTLRAQADALLDAGVTGSGITNMDVMEALLGDLGEIMANRDPRYLAVLVQQDADHLASQPTDVSHKFGTIHSAF